MKYKINKGFVSQKLNSKMVIFDGETSLLYTFNETASFIFQKIKRGVDRKKILEALVEKYDVGKTKATEDLNDLIKSLLKKKIISARKIM